MRPIGPGDKGLLESGLACLSPASAYQRFLTGKRTFTARELRYLTEVDHRDHMAQVVLDGDGRLVAVGRLMRDDERPDTAELAIVVGDGWQRRGIGRELARRLTSAMDVERVSGTMLADNRAALALMKGIGPLERTTVSAGVREVVARRLVRLGPIPLKQPETAPILTM
jgi:RimJ/RimL family protein N-acetyltransferase